MGEALNVYFLGLSIPIHIDITHQGGAWDLESLAPLVDSAVSATVKCLELADEAELSIVLADNAFIQDLNKRYRGFDKPTNVLSFPQDIPGHLGDIVLAYETIAQEATAQGKDFEHHFMHLVVHGMLHLLDYDHESDEEAEEMEALEIKVLNGLGIENPYT